ncbi:MAG TPA: short-chain dehydrogenase/reductase [Solirubrobacteraceae bacterium]|nr:short-chain dehydrogenase/reductase [Solirubrobacteraceae bacterium]
MTRFTLLDRTVLITGPARGIGAETARHLARRGANVALVGLEPERLEALAAEVGTDRAAWWEADVRDWDALRAATDGAVERFGGIDVAVANAGIAPWGTVETIDPEQFEACLEVNLLGVWRTIRTVLPHVRERQGYLLPIASLAAALHAPLITHYNATKAGVEAFADGLRVELSGTGTDVGVAYFGFIDTDMVRQVETDPLAEALRDPGDSAFSRPVPVEGAAAAIVRGIERRARRVYHPRWILPVLLAPAPFQRLAELQMRREGISGTVAEINARARQLRVGGRVD